MSLVGGVAELSSSTAGVLPPRSDHNAKKARATITAKKAQYLFFCTLGRCSFMAWDSRPRKAFCKVVKLGAIESFFELPVVELNHFPHSLHDG